MNIFNIAWLIISWEVNIYVMSAVNEPRSWFIYLEIYFRRIFIAFLTFLRTIFVKISINDLLFKKFGILMKIAQYSGCPNSPSKTGIPDFLNIRFLFKNDSRYSFVYEFYSEHIFAYNAKYSFVYVLIIHIRSKTNYVLYPL